MYEALIKDVPNFPTEGIMFKDITPIFENAQAFSKLIDDASDFIKSNYKVDKLALIESRGFIFGSALSLKMNLPFSLIRKPGKLPRETYEESYDLEYGKDKLQVHKDSFAKGESVLIVDDLLATGGTAAAAEKLIEKCGAVQAGVFCIIDLAFLKGKQNLSSPFGSLISY